MNEHKRVSQQQVFACSIFSVDEEEFSYRDKSFTRYSVRHPGAAVFLPKTENGSLLLVRQFRAPLMSYLLEAPAGTLGIGEVPLDCAKREIQEEVGMRAEQWISLGELYPAPGFCDERQFLFLASELHPSSLPQDEDEDIEVVEYSVTEVERGIADGEIVDGKTVALFSRARFGGLI
ncbi:MAG: NUDIX hydrolase [Bdellovibrionales bacterium]|nr:NUDIX hydrolase [Bdellovibrionales bacterium]